MGRRPKVQKQLSLLHVGREAAFIAGNAARWIHCGCLRTVARSTVLSDVEFCMDAETIDVVLASGEYRKEELTRFAAEAQRRGFSGLILQIADPPEKSDDLNPGQTLQLGDFVLDSLSRRVWVRGMEVHFRPLEFDLLGYLCAHADQHLSHKALAAAIWHDPSMSAQNIRALVGAVRAKIETGMPWRYILTRYHGYRFVPNANWEPSED
jgi:DNA-binding winged helix-turn-helix (wHTH) protein